MVRFALRPDLATRRALPLLVGAFLAASLLATAPPTARAGNVPTTTTATYELLPDQGRVVVTVILKVTNLIPSVTQGYVTTNYFIDEISFAAHENATNFRSSLGSVTLERTAGYLPTATVHFPGIYYGVSRSITVTYDIPGSPPRSDDPTRIGKAFASFCAFPAGVYTGDPESFSVIIPSRFAILQTAGPTLPSATISDNRTQLASAQVATSTDDDFQGACFEATNSAAFAQSEATSPSGITITTEAWPEDQAWTDAINGTAGDDVAALEEAIGRPPSTDDITIREVLAEDLAGYAGVFDAESSVARVAEDALDPIVAAHELAHAWFNASFTQENWLWEGYAEYFGRTVLGPTVIEPCPEPDQATLDVVNLGDWAYLPPVWTAEDSAKVDAQYDVACWVLTAVANRIGDDAMKEVVQAGTEWEIPYAGAEPEVIDPRPLTWQRWMDLVDERGMVPAGESDLDWLQDLLKDLGAASGTTNLTDRSATRAAYHALLDASSPWYAPVALRQAMSKWEFDDANDLIAVATDIDGAHDAAVADVPEAADSTVVEDAYEAAEDADELDAALALAQDEADAAEVVGGAVEASEAEANPLEAVGLLGADLGADAATSVDALVAGDYDAATTTGQTTIDAKSNAALGGALRIGIVLLLGAAVGGGLVFWRRRQAAKLTPLAEGAALDSRPAEISETGEGAEERVPPVESVSESEPDLGRSSGDLEPVPEESEPRAEDESGQDQTEED